MSPEEAKKKLDTLESQISYEQNLITRSNSYAGSKQTAKVSENLLKKMYKEREDLKKYL